jgi:hypothetical protein
VVAIDGVGEAVLAEKALTEGVVSVLLHVSKSCVEMSVGTDQVVLDASRVSLDLHRHRTVSFAVPPWSRSF